ncbi:SMP-30/gluconolactonase/LRE family protein [Roseinatronobacter sp. S2]|uniref:SMP-30/gluconolactonase/LRE family protein n=1 Tax=Roseinatronobacter sp. S2 TaxID=3035471 RepID=UPI00240EF7FF|nr:SMP-30/gluconolactonase/LRE family protein [Roseinatronobacter sp. S2]WFE75646.1 SMP-30/gluconolactonase/LRE family protein [Roseinatronobacter sp. S2]
MTPINDIRCTLGEGPLWHPERAEFFWFDILGGKLHSLNRSWTFDEYVSAAGWVDRNTLLVASETRLFVFDLETGGQRDLCPLEADNRITRSNDGRADPQGGFWIGTMGKHAEHGAGAIWRWYRGELRKLFGDISIPNAICFAPDGRSACFTDTPTRRIMRVGLDAQGWPAGTPECWLDLNADGYNPDGAVFDAAGNFWLAQWGAGRVACYGPDGAFLRAVSFPASHTSCPAFGGPDLTDLYCTTAREGHATPAPLDGATFCVPDVGKGLQEHRVVLDA